MMLLRAKWRAFPLVNLYQICRSNPMEPKKLRKSNVPKLPLDGSIKTYKMAYISHAYAYWNKTKGTSLSF